MRPSLAAVLVAATFLSPAAARADCAAEIAGLYQGGGLDPFLRPNMRETTVARHPDGSETPVSDVLWDGPVKSINCTPNGCFMAIGSKSWSGAGFDGPWTFSGDMGIADAQAFARATADRFAASVSEAECLGTTELDGRAVRVYRFYSKPEPNEYGSWWGGRHTLWIDADTGLQLRREIAESVASWAPQPSPDVQVSTNAYDPAIAIAAPE